MLSRLRSYLFNSDNDNVNADQNTDDFNTDEVDFDQNNDDVSTELSIDDRKSVREDEITTKIFSYSTDQFSCDQVDFDQNNDDVSTKLSSNDFDVDLWKDQRYQLYGTQFARYRDRIWSRRSSQSK